MSASVSLAVRVLPIESLTPAPYNPRHVLSPADRWYKKLAASLREFGLVEPLVWNEVTGHVVGGHADPGELVQCGLERLHAHVDMRLAGCQRRPDP